MKAELDMLDRALAEACCETERRLAPAVLAAIRRQGWTLTPPPRFLARPIDHTLDYEVVDTRADVQIREFSYTGTRGRARLLAETFADGLMLGYGERMAGR